MIQIHTFEYFIYEGMNLCIPLFAIRIHTFSYIYEK